MDSSTRRTWLAFLCTLVFIACSARIASAQKVLLLAAEDPASTEDVRAKLAATGLLTQVDVIDARDAANTPTLTTLLGYDAVLTWSDFSYGDGGALGDVLADYVDHGHGVVQAVFDFYPGASLFLDGRWHAWGYEPFSPGFPDGAPGLTLVPDLPAHPILNGVAGFNGGESSYFHSGISLGACTVQVAHWSNGQPLIATRRGPQGGRVVGLNFYPPSSDARADYWDATTGGAMLMANALRYAASPVPAGTGPKVALLAADDPALAEDVRCKLEQLGAFGQVDRIDARATTVPSLATLMQDNAVLTWSDAGYGVSSDLGDVLANYVDQGRGVVEAVFAFYTGPGPRLDGRWRTAGYRPFGEGPVTALPGLTLVAQIPGHPILNGVSSFNGGTSSYHSAPITPEDGTTLVAEWSDGEPLVGVRPGPSTGQIVGLNMFPPSSDARADFWDRTTDGAQLIANTLLFAGAPPAPTNHPPTADAGPDRTIEATSAAGASFTLSATASDPDGDPLTFIWSGAATASGQTATVVLAPPASPATSQTYTVILTVSDGKGGQTTDSVNLTVTDKTGPVLSNVPASVVTATATSAAGATVVYGPITAMDTVDGARPVVCSKSGVFPIGDTAVTCSASDTRANSSSVTFTVRVQDVTTPGHMFGDGFIRQGSVTYLFAFDVLERSKQQAVFGLLVDDDTPGHRGHDSRFVTTTTNFVAFSDDPTIRPGHAKNPQVDTVLFSGTGTWNGVGGYHYEVNAVDNGEPGRHRESVGITITSPSGVVVAHVDGTLSGGNVQSVRIRH